MPKGLLIAVVAMLLVSCSERAVDAVVVDAPRAEWLPNEALELCYNNCDTLGGYDLSVVARCGATNNTQALPLRVEVHSPSGVQFGSEVVLVPTERHKGGSFVELSTEWIRDARFMEMGDYHFFVTPSQPADGVWNVGVRLDRAE